MSTDYKETSIHCFIRAYMQSKAGNIVEGSETFTVTFPYVSGLYEYTYQSGLAKEKKITLLAPGSPAFQGILKECLASGSLCQILLNPKQTYEAVVKRVFRDLAFDCKDCEKLSVDIEEVLVCPKPYPCYHKINNGKIQRVNVIKKEAAQYYQFYYSITFQTRLRPKNEEIVAILLDEDANVVSVGHLCEDNILDDVICNEDLEIGDFKGKIKAQVFDQLKTAAEERLNVMLKEKLVIFDLSLAKEKKIKLNSYDKRLRRQRHDEIVSRKHNFDQLTWQANYTALLKREEESLQTSIAVKLNNLLVINTSKVTFDLVLDNHAVVRTTLTLGISQTPKITCPLCKKPFTEGFATQDGLYVCTNCTRQSIDTAKIYSKKAPLKLDESLNEYIEGDNGFVCTVCGKRHSRFLEFKCSHDNSSVCIYHYETCDICGKTVSKSNILHTAEFKRKLCPKHATKCEECKVIIGIDEGGVCKKTGKRLCSNCLTQVKR